MATERINSGRIRWWQWMLIIVGACVSLVLGFATDLVTFKVLYERAVTKCQTEAETLHLEGGTGHGWVNSPPGFTCTYRHKDGSVEKINYGLIP